jgi:hypothetical protein
MNKNVFLTLLTILALFIIAGLFFFIPQQTATQSKPLSNHQTSSASPISHINIKMEKISSHNSAIKQSSSTSTVHSKERNSSIKAATIDHYNQYLIQLIDENPEDQNIMLQKDPSTYMYIEGKVEGKQFVLRTPKAVIDRPNIKLKVTNLKTKKSKVIDASFLSEAATLPDRGRFHIDIDLKTNSVQTKVEEPEEYPPFPTF